MMHPLPHAATRHQDDNTPSIHFNCFLAACSRAIPVEHQFTTCHARCLPHCLTCDPVPRHTAQSMTPLPPSAEVLKRRRDREASRAAKQQRKQAAASALDRLRTQDFKLPFSAEQHSIEAGTVGATAAVPPTGPSPTLPVALLFPGQVCTVP